jgi:small-conductance mechanosensitive channel
LISTTGFQLTVYDLIIAFLFVLIAIGLLRFFKVFFRRLEKRKRLDYGAANSIYQIIKYIIWVIVVAFVLQTIGIDVTVLIAGSAALFVGLGFGLQNLFNDFASGIIILMERTTKVGDVLQLEDGSVGKVVNIGLRVSEIKDRNNIINIVPNSKLVNDKVINWSHTEDLTRFNVAVGVAYGSDVKLVHDLLLKSADKHENIALNPAPFVRFSDFGDSSLMFELYFWTSDSFMVENIKSEIRFSIDQLFREHDVVIAFPQLDVHLDAPLP